MSTDIVWSKTKSAQSQKQKNCALCCSLVGGTGTTSVATPDPTDDSQDVDETQTPPMPDLSPNAEDVLRESDETEALDDIREEVGAEALDSICSQLVSLRVGGFFVQSIDLGIV